MLTNIKYFLSLLLIFGFSLASFSQEKNEEGKKEKAPAYQLFRELENYSYLKEESNFETDFWDPIKFIPFNASKNIYLTVGGEFRPRFEYFNNNNWGETAEKNDAFYSQRLALYSSLSLAKYVRLYGEIYHGILSKEEKVFAEDDNVDLFQGFLDINLPLKDNKLTFRLGRQEMAFGATRLVGIREGFNLRRSFDAARAIYKSDKITIESFYGREVIVAPGNGAFENKRDDHMDFYGIYSRINHIGRLPGQTELYYFGFEIDQAIFNDGTGAEIRHTLGIRRHGKVGKHVLFNTEIMYQFGTFADKDINAWAIELDYHYSFLNTEHLKSVGFKLDYISGDRTAGDDKLQTFNPLFTNPAYFGLLTVLTPVNLMDIHPSSKWKLGENIEFSFDWDFFWRASKNDGLYRPTRFLARDGQNADSRFIGHKPGIVLGYKVSRHIKWSVDASYFISGPFIKETGESENIFHFATTTSYKF